MLNIMNFELVTLIEVGELLEDAGYAYWKHTKYSRPSKRPRIQMEIATWAPENRKEVMKRRADYIKKYEPFPVSIHDPQYKPGVHMIWWDVSSNRSFCLIYDNPGFDDAKGILNEYKPGLDKMNFELFNVLEIHDYLEYAGK